MIKLLLFVSERCMRDTVSDLPGLSIKQGGLRPTGLMA